MAEAAQRLLDSLGNSLCLDVHHKEEGDGEIPAKVLVDYSMERRRKQKMLCSQLQVLRFLLELLQEADTANWEEMSPELLNKEVEEVKKQWKSLRSEYQEKVNEVEELIPQLLEKIQLIQERKTQLEETMERYQAQARERQQHLQEVYQEQQVVVQKCQIQIAQLKDEVQELEQSVACWIRTVSRDAKFAGLLSMHGVSLLSVGENELLLDLHVINKTEIPPLRVNLHLSSEGDFQVEPEDSMLTLPPELRRGAISHIIAIILELQCWYQSHATLLKELKELQQRFAIDWQPAERQLVFLNRNKQHRLAIGPGYPVSGGVRLLSVKGAEPCATADKIKPPVENPSLSDWLEYLHGYPDYSTQ
ncbi:outer kinetochore KNL1 complex subunit ZWINT isoform X1 [Ranitomeya variabilis]|uniref:outer kinetochore KNL1 complex subunit ZWINT isoform X1 n=2 Tax=Ranitomeya variabilis TaxID=490064 RepID=UPI0040569B8C